MCSCDDSSTDDTTTTGQDQYTLSPYTPSGYGSGLSAERTTSIRGTSARQEAALHYAAPPDTAQSLSSAGPFAAGDTNPLITYWQGNHLLPSSMRGSCSAHVH
jgi:hypothetical protein